MSPKRRSKELEDFIRAKHKEIDSVEMAKEIKEKFGIEYTERRMSQIKYEMGLRDSKRTLKGSYIFTKEMQEKIVEYYMIPKTTYQVADMINQEFGTDFTRQQIKSFVRNRRIRNGASAMRRDGLHSRTGRKLTEEQYERLSKHFFKAGHTPPHKVPVGTVHKDPRGYRFIKVGEPSEWRLQHIVIWEKENGPIPEEHFIIFKDRNKDNVSIENLMMVDRSTLFAMVNNGLYTENPEITECGATYVKLKKELKKKKKEMKDGSNQ